MTIVNGYGTLQEFLNRYLAGAGADTTRDATIEQQIQAASRMIEQNTDRVFYPSTAHTARVFTAQNSRRCYIDDLLVCDNVKTDLIGSGNYTQTWLTSDFRLMPLNASSYGAPYTFIETTINSGQFFPLMVACVQVTGTWNYSATTPELISEACYLQAYRWYLRKTSPFGIIGGAENQPAIKITKLDPDICEMIDPFMRWSN